MNSIDLMLMGLKNLWRRKARTFLTVLGVIIGASSIIIMISIGFGLKKSMIDEMSSYASLTEIEVYAPYEKTVSGSGSSSNELYLDDKAVETFYSIPGVDAVMPIVRTRMEILKGKSRSYANITATDLSVLEKFGLTIIEGEMPSSSAKNVIICNADVKDTFYNERTGMEMYDVELLDKRFNAFIEGEYYGDGLKKRPYKIKVVGIVSQQNEYMGRNIYMSIDAYEKLKKDNDKKYGSNDDGRGVKDKNKYSNIKIQAVDMKSVEEIQEQIKALGYESWSNTEWLNQQKKSMGIIQAILGGIGAVSLLVAAIGITNTMIMSIYERTKEIGVMKVLGAKLKDIRNLFLFEAALIGLIGGIFGIAFSTGVSVLLNKIVAPMLADGMGGGPVTLSYIPWYLYIGGLIFSAMVGIVSGFFPARRAMKLSALKAISTN